MNLQKRPLTTRKKHKKQAEEAAKEAAKRPDPRSQPAPLPNRELVSVEEIQAATGWSHVFIWKLVKDGHLPKPRRIGARMVRWLTAEVRQVITNGTGEWTPRKIGKPRTGAAA